MKVVGWSRVRWPWEKRREERAFNDAFKLMAQCRYWELPVAQCIIDPELDNGTDVA